VTRIKTIGTILFAAIVTACAAIGRGAGDCEATDISAVLASPLAYHGMRFCGEGVLYADSELAAIYERPVSNREQRFDAGFLLIAPSNGRSPQLSGINVPVYVTGRVIGDACPRDGEAACVPIRHAVFLEDWEVRLLSSD
jgi:hypothetical protein